MNEFLRGAFVIARRDFVATVFSRSFILFLLAPLFPVVVGLIFGGLTVRAMDSDGPGRVVAVIADRQDFAALSAARGRLEEAFENAPLVELRHVQPAADEQAQRQGLLRGDPPVLGVLEGGLESPRLSSTLPPPNVVVQQVQLMVERARMAPEPRGPPVALSVAQCPARPIELVAPNRAMTARAAQGILFVLTLVLATMLLSQLIEEKANKIIEVLAAAVPVGAIFLGKLLAMLSVSLLGIAVWGSGAAAAIGSFADQGLAAIPPPAVGWPLFLLFALVYFAMSYLLLGAVFLGIGGHASSAREVQTLSMPVTMAQVVVFAIATIAVGEPNSAKALAAAAFPLSSPYVMLARSAELPDLWPHLLAVAWQLLWVGLILALAARLFRRSVLKSGPSAPRRRRAPA